MMELQAAIGVAQLNKLDTVIARQRANRDAMWSAIKDIPGVEPREIVDGAYDTADALVFFVPSARVARACRSELLEDGLGTKILPEAYSWHFAGTWSHMPELVSRHGGDLLGAFPDTAALLGRSVALPVNVAPMAEDVPMRIKAAIERAVRL